MKLSLVFFLLAIALVAVINLLSLSTTGPLTAFLAAFGIAMFAIFFGLIAFANKQKKNHQ